MSTAILMLLPIIFMGLLSYYLLEKHFDTFVLSLVGFALVVSTAIGIVAYSINIYSWFAAEHKANIINREYGTRYTQAEVFYGSSVINTIRELDRKRVEVNGDLITGN